MVVSLSPPRLGGTLSLPTSAANQPTPAPDPFVWGEGGVRMTPAEIAALRASARGQIAVGANYFPVGHWAQGLARRQRPIRRAERAPGSTCRTCECDRKQRRAGGAARGTVDHGLTAPTPSIASLLANPSLDPDVRKFGMERYAAATKRRPRWRSTISWLIPLRSGRSRAR